MDAVSSSAALSSSASARRDAVEIAMLRQTQAAEQAVVNMIAQATDAAKTEMPAVAVQAGLGNLVDRRI